MELAFYDTDPVDLDAGFVTFDSFLFDYGEEQIDRLIIESGATNVGLEPAASSRSPPFGSSIILTKGKDEALFLPLPYLMSRALPIKDLAPEKLGPISKFTFGITAPNIVVPTSTLILQPDTLPLRFWSTGNSDEDETVMSSPRCSKHRDSSELIEEEKRDEGKTLSPDKAYVCPALGCPQSYCRKGDLKVHVRAKHQDQPELPNRISPSRSAKRGKDHPCPFADCPSGYARKANLLNHLAVKHGLLGAQKPQNFTFVAYSGVTAQFEGK